MPTKTGFQESGEILNSCQSVEFEAAHCTAVLERFDLLLPFAFYLLPSTFYLLPFAFYLQTPFPTPTRSRSAAASDISDGIPSWTRDGVLPLF